MQKGHNHDACSTSRQSLEKMFSGKVELDTATHAWFYRKGHSRFTMMATAEGVKKVAILDTLLGNRFLSKDSIVFIYESESARHPTVIANEEKMSLPVLTPNRNNHWFQTCLFKDGMPDTEIINDIGEVI